MENPEIHPPHARHGGLPRWLELVIAVTALITSICSIAIAVHHGQIMDRLVKANSIPYLQGGLSDITPDGSRVLSLHLLNRGVGPAHEKSLRVKVDGKYVRSTAELFRVSLGPERAAEAETAAGDAAKNRIRTRFVPGGEEQPIFWLPRTKENEDYWHLLEAAQGRWSIEYCYCSVFDECWQVLGKWEEPAPIEACVRDEPNEFLP
jgi:hypothetical protein